LPSVGETRGAIWVEVTVQGHRLNVVDTHLGLRAGDRMQQVSTLLGEDWTGSAAFRKLPAIICGDLNAVGSSSAYRRLAQHFQDAQLLAGSSTESVRREIVSLMPALGAFARTFYRNAADADDMVQETLVRALIHLDRYEEGTRLKSWLFTIMRNTFCTRNRVTRREAVGTLECVSSREKAFSGTRNGAFEVMNWRRPVCACPRNIAAPSSSSSLTQLRGSCGSFSVPYRHH